MRSDHGPWNLPENKFKMKIKSIINKSLKTNILLSSHYLINNPMGVSQIFGMTRRQFLKKSRKTLQKTSENLLALMQIMEKEQNQTIKYETAYWKLDVLREDIESIFFEYENLKPPRNCDKLHLKIMDLLVKFQEVIVTNQEFLGLAEKSSPQSKQKYRESEKKLEEFRIDFRLITEIVKTSLKRK
ncbi:MAG: hypothetical protein Kow0019_19560 [Methanobacteriaceae archaeon]